MKNIDEELTEVQKLFSEGSYQLALRKINNTNKHAIIKLRIIA